MSAPCLIGENFGIWTVQGRAPATDRPGARWECQCPYGHPRVITGHTLRKSPPQCQECRKAQQEGRSLPLVGIHTPPPTQKPDPPPRPKTRHEEATEREQHELAALVRQIGLTEYLATLVTPSERELSFLSKYAARPDVPYLDHQRCHQFILQTRNRIG